MFTFTVDPQAVLDERARQFTALGVPAGAVARARDRIGEMWGDGEDGWGPVWAAEAERAGRERGPLAESLCWGAARFPCLATEARRDAHRRQLERYLDAAPRFRARFRRRILHVPHPGDGTGNATTPVPAHLFRRPFGRPRGVLILSGGVDTWKMDLHRLAVTTALATGFIVAAIDMPGTGESELVLTPGADRVLAALAGELRREYGLPTGFLGLSFGGHWAAKLALLGEVDAAVDLGGPTGAAATPVDVLNLPYGMTGILGNALGLDAPPGPGRAAELLDAFSLRGQGLLDPGRAGRAAPLLAVNGARDQYIPPGDTTGLAGRPGTAVWLVAGATHCAPERFRVLMPAIWGWLAARLSPGPAARAAERALRLPLTRLIAGGPAA
ncbi:alpha/beta hydrolase [Spirillospora sp. NPDC048819]|uniref:alpha/beta hydrolase family protein n=1 Tax=Spirillospora sp. NPDC048819 TaxID=3155268 RepID=UPI0033E9CC5B